MENMDLGLDIDQAATAQSADSFLRHDFRKYLLRAGMRYSDLLSGTQLDPTGVASHGKNSAEKRLVKILDMQERCLAVYQAIEHCSDMQKQPYRKILECLYFKHLTDYQTAIQVGYSKSRLSDLKKNALCEFADAIDTWKVYYDVDIPDLKVEKKKK